MLRPLSPFHSVLDSVHGMVLPTLGRAFPTSLNSIKKLPHRYDWRFISYMILDPLSVDSVNHLTVP